MKTVYRVESKHTGNGWYNHNHELVGEWLNGPQSIWRQLQLTSIEWTTDSHQQPTPWSNSEALDSITPFEYCGFNSVAQMLDWFHPAMVREVMFGAMSEWFEIVEYHVEEDLVREGLYQLVFVLSEAKSRQVIDYLPV